MHFNVSSTAKTINFCARCLQLAIKRELSNASLEYKSVVEEHIYLYVLGLLLCTISLSSRGCYQYRDTRIIVQSDVTHRLQYNKRHHHQKQFHQLHT